MTTELPCANRQCQKPGACKRVMNKGTVYRCASALAAVYGVTPSAVYQALSRTGSTDCLGRAKVGGGMPGTPVHFGKRQWPSITALALDIGLDRSTVGKKLRRDPQSLMALVIKVKG